MADNQVARMQELRSGGLSYKAIGETVGLSERGVRLYLCPGVRQQDRETTETYAVTHKEELRQYKAQYYRMHKDEYRVKSAAYYKENKPRIRLRHTEYKANNQEQTCAYSAAYRAGHKEEIQRYLSKWHKDHQTEHNTRNATRRALKRGALIGATLTQLAEIKEIYRRAKEDPKVRCYLCGKLIPLGHRHVDHIAPLSKGGAHRSSNLAAACDTCNQSKGAKMPEELGVLL